MFGFSRRRMKLGRLKVHLSDSTQGTRSPMRHIKSSRKSIAQEVATSNLDERNCENSPAEGELRNCTSGNSESWMMLSTAGDKPTPRFDHAATVIGDKMVVVGGDSGHGLLDDVQVLSFENFTWSTTSSKLYLSPTNFPLKIPACKGHCLVSWGKKALLIGGKTDHRGDRVSVWAFDTESECWSLIEAKGEIPVARSGHTVIRAGSVLILFGGEDYKRRKLNDLHMFDLKSLMWLPLHCTGAGPSPRSNHVAALHDDRILYIFGGTSKSRTLNDLYSLDFETMIWTKIKIRGFHPSPRAGCCGVLSGYQWFIAGGGSRKKRHTETLVFDVLKVEWSVVVLSPPSINTNKGFTMVLVQHKEKLFLVTFGGCKKEPSNQVEVLIMEKNELSIVRKSPLDKSLSLESRSCAMKLATQAGTASRTCPIGSTKHNLASVLDRHGSTRKSISESCLVDSNDVSGNISLGKQLHKEEFSVVEHITRMQDTGVQKDICGSVISREDLSKVHHKQEGTNLSHNHDMIIPDTIEKSVGSHQLYETKLDTLIRKNGILEGQLTAALASVEAANHNVSSVTKSKQETDKKLAEALKEMELLKEKVASLELAQEESSNISNMVHSDNVRLEHDVAFLKAVLEDTQKELHSTRGVAGERARAFQLQVEVFHLKQRLQSKENRAATPRKPFQM